MLRSFAPRAAQSRLLCPSSASRTDEQIDKPTPPRRWREKGETDG
jgi:hypothetical protein